MKSDHSLTRTMSLALLVVLLTGRLCHAEVPRVFRERSFNPAMLAQAVNHFASLGEEAAARELGELGIDNDLRSEINPAERVGWVCRVLFEPRGKEPLRQPLYGGLQLPWQSMPLARWPVYPVALSGSSYFVLSQGYSLGGVAEDPRQYIAYCRENGIFRKTLVTVPSREQALKDAAALRRSESWKAIKWTDQGENWSYSLEEEQVWKSIKWQASYVPPRFVAGSAMIPGGAMALRLVAPKVIRSRRLGGTVPARDAVGSQQDPISSLTWSPDSSQLAASGPGYGVHVWQVASGREVRWRHAPSSSGSSIAWSPDGTRIALANANHTMGIRTAATGQLTRTLGHPFQAPSWFDDSACWSPDGRYLASGSTDRKGAIWDAATGQKVRELLQPAWSRGLVYVVAWSPDGKQIATSGAEYVHLYRAATGFRERTLTFRGDDIAWSPSGKWFAIGDAAGDAIHLYSTAKWELELELRHQGVTAISWSPDGRYLASSGLDGKVRIWYAASGQRLRELRDALGKGSPVYTVSWSPDGKHLACGGPRAMVQVWDLALPRDQTYRRPQRIPSGSDPVKAGAVRVR